MSCAWSSSRPLARRCFGEAGRALAEIMLGERPSRARRPCGGSSRCARETAPRCWSSGSTSSISLSEITKEVFTHFRVDHVDDTEVRAIVDGVSPELLQTAVKAATLHGVAVEPVRGRLARQRRPRRLSEP